MKIPSRKSVERTPFLHITKKQLLALYDRLEFLEGQLPEPPIVEPPRIKLRALAPVEQEALERAYAVITDLVYLYGVNRGNGSSPTVYTVEKRLYAEASAALALLKKLPSLRTLSASGDKPQPDEYKRIFMGAGERSAAEAYRLEKLLRDSITSLGGLQQGVSSEDSGREEVERNARTIYTALTGKELP